MSAAFNSLTTMFVRDRRSVNVNKLDSSKRYKQKKKTEIYHKK